MTIELSQTTKIIILVALAIVAAGAGLFLLEQNKSGSKPVVTTPVSLEPLPRRAVSRPHTTPARHADRRPGGC